MNQHSELQDDLGKQHFSWDWVNKLGAVIALLVIYLGFGVYLYFKNDNWGFFSVGTVDDIGRQMMVVWTAALAMTVVMILGGIDLSVGSIIALSSVVLAKVLNIQYMDGEVAKYYVEAYPVFWPFVAVAAAMGAGALCGLFNGVLIVGLKVVPFIVTLGTLLLLRGMALTVAGQGKVEPEGGRVWVDNILKPGTERVFETRLSDYPGIQMFITTAWWIVAAVVACIVLRKIWSSLNRSSISYIGGWVIAVAAHLGVVYWFVTNKLFAVLGNLNYSIVDVKGFVGWVCLGAMLLMAVGSIWKAAWVGHRCCALLSKFSFWVVCLLFPVLSLAMFLDDWLLGVVLWLFVLFAGLFLYRKAGHTSDANSFLSTGVKVAGWGFVVTGLCCFMSIVRYWSAGFWAMSLVSLMMAGVLLYTRFGRHVFAVGSNEQTARLCGIAVGRTKIITYMLMGLFAGMSGVMLFSRIGVGSSTAGQGKELDIIAAVVIGGGSLAGGKGSILGAIMGAAIMQLIYFGCTRAGVDDGSQRMVTGGIIVIAVALDRLRRGGDE